MHTNSRLPPTTRRIEQAILHSHGGHGLTFACTLIEAWDLAHYYGYKYPGIRFNELTCLALVPTCGGGTREASSKCPTGTSPIRRLGGDEQIRPPSRSLGFDGWADSGCVERAVVDENEATLYFGVRGVLSEKELAAVSSRLNSSPLLSGLLDQLFGTRVRERSRSSRGDGFPIAPSTQISTICLLFLGAATMFHYRRKYIPVRVKQKTTL